MLNETLPIDDHTQGMFSLNKGIFIQFSKKGSGELWYYILRFFI